MRVHRRVRKLNELEEKQFIDYLEKKLMSLRNFWEKHYPDEDTVHVFANIEKHVKHNAFAFECSVEMPRKRLVSSEAKHSITEALDFTIKRLEQQMVKHFKKLTRA